MQAAKCACAKFPTRFFSSNVILVFESSLTAKLTFYIYLIVWIPQKNSCFDDASNVAPKIKYNGNQRQLPNQIQQQNQKLTRAEVPAPVPSPD